MANNVPLLPSYGVDVVPLVGPGTAITDWLRQRGVNHYVHSTDLPGAWPKQLGLGRASLPWRYYRCGVRARDLMSRLVVEERIDLILAALPFAWFTGTLVAREHGLPIIWRAGGCAVNTVQKASLWMVTRGLRPDLLVCCAEAVKRTVSPYVPAPVEVVANGVDADQFRLGAGDPTRYRPRDASVVIGCAVRLTTTKRPEDFIRLAARMRATHPHVRFLLAGEGSKRADYESMARALGADNLTLLGYVPDMPSFYAACDLVVLPSRAEGCPNFVLESMAMGKVVVATNVPGVLEIIRHGENGLVYPWGDVDALVRCVASIVDRPELLARLSENGLEKARSLTARACARTIARLVRGLVGANSKTTHIRSRAPEPRLLARSGAA